MERFIHFTNRTQSVLKRCASAIAVLSLFATSAIPAFASSWDPTLLVNTESFQTIDDGDGTTDIYLEFGDAAGEQLQWSIGQDAFIFTDDLQVYGDISASGALLINQDNAGDATITFGGTAPQTITATAGGQVIQISTGATFAGHLSGASIAIDDLASCEVIASDANGRLICTTQDILTQAEADDRYVNVAGDTMTGTLVVNDENNIGIVTSDNLTASGTLTVGDDNANGTINFGSALETLTWNNVASQFEFSDDVHSTGELSQDGSNFTINEDDTVGDVSITFGDADADETITWDNTEQEFDFSDDISVAGTLSGTALTVDGPSVTINGVTYAFPNAQGGADEVLVNDGAGNLTWQSSAVANGSGHIISMHPQYPNAIYEPDGGSNIGRLQLDRVSGDNMYKWYSTRSTLQDYDIVVRMRIPDNFDSWDTQSGVTLQYVTASGVAADNRVNVEVLDTTGASDTTSGDLASATKDTYEANEAALNGTYTPGQYMTVIIKLSDRNDGTITDGTHVGWLNFNWNTTTP